VKHPTLYKKTSTGALQQWTIGVNSSSDGTCGIVVEYGQVGGAMQTAADTISEGKNIGRSNETTPYQQALAEAEALWLGKKKKGYVETMEAALHGSVDSAVIAGGVEPMLAHSFDKHSHKVVYPCFVQPKLDGIRCLAVVQDGTCTLWSRTRKPILSCDHIKDAIEALHLEDGTVLDGELYNHALHDDFEQIVSAVRKGETTATSRMKVQYHIYDQIAGYDFEDRSRVLGSIPWRAPLILVETHEVVDEREARAARQHYADLGYEGVMVRNKRSGYKHGRSYDLLKLKEFTDAEFVIVDVVEGRGKMAGKGIFVCKNENGDTFQVKMEGSLDKLAEVWQNGGEYVGQMLTVRYQSLTTAGIPRFPIGVVVRDYE